MRITSLGFFFVVVSLSAILCIQSSSFAKQGAAEPHETDQLVYYLSGINFELADGKKDQEVDFGEYYIKAKYVVYYTGDKFVEKRDAFKRKEICDFGISDKFEIKGRKDRPIAFDSYDSIPAVFVINPETLNECEIEAADFETELHKVKAYYSSGDTGPKYGTVRGIEFTLYKNGIFKDSKVADLVVTDAYYETYLDEERDLSGVGEMKLSFTNKVIDLAHDYFYSQYWDPSFTFAGNKESSYTIGIAGEDNRAFLKIERKYDSSVPAELSVSGKGDFVEADGGDYVRFYISNVATTGCFKIEDHNPIKAGDFYVNVNYVVYKIDSEDTEDPEGFYSRDVICNLGEGNSFEVFHGFYDERNDRYNPGKSFTMNDSPGVFTISRQRLEECIRKGNEKYALIEKKAEEDKEKACKPGFLTKLFIPGYESIAKDCQAIQETLDDMSREMGYVVPEGNAIHGLEFNLVSDGMVFNSTVARTLLTDIYEPQNSVVYHADVHRMNHSDVTLDFTDNWESPSISLRREDKRYGKEYGGFEYISVAFDRVIGNLMN